MIRWLFSTVGVAMIFDDHDVHDDWNTSIPWLEEMRAKPWWEERIESALASYWIYQHLGNLSPAALAEDELLRAGEGAPRTRARCCATSRKRADHGSDGSRWSFCRDLGRVRLCMFDSREGRVLGKRPRKMIDDKEWEWITEHARRRLRPLPVRRHAAVPAGAGAAPRRGLERGGLRRRLGRVGGRDRRAHPPRARPRALGRVQRVVPADGAADRRDRLRAGAGRRPRRSSGSAATCTTPTWPRSPSRPRRACRAPSTRRSARRFATRSTRASAVVVRNAARRGSGAGHAPAGARGRRAGPGDPWRLAQSPTFDNQFATLELRRPQRRCCGSSARCATTPTTAASRPRSSGGSRSARVRSVRNSARLQHLTAVRV